MHPDFKIVSGGQTGPDTAAIKTAIAHRIPYTGYVPHGFTNEKGRILESYISSPFGSLTETEPERDPNRTPNAERTLLNVRQSDGLLTLAFCSEEDLGLVSRGTELGIECGKDRRKTMWFVDLRRYRDGVGEEVEGVIKWLEEEEVKACAIGGPRESEEPGVEEETERFLMEVWEKVRERGWKGSTFG
ncbi:hypothetical protein AA313_de0204864 [Arthrobotrys entomopaga]|nr:hypothetical protein AA313_de0204864 [Arthrobotrys entomopaga]